MLLYSSHGPTVYYVPEVGSGWYALAAPWSWPGPPAVVIPRGFTHDLGLAAPLVHDYLYRNGGVTRLRADRALLALMVEAGVSIRLRRLVYGAVRFGGWWAWRRARRRG